MHMHYLWYWMGIKREKTRGVLFTQSRQKYSFVREREEKEEVIISSQTQFFHLSHQFSLYPPLLLSPR